MIIIPNRRLSISCWRGRSMNINVSWEKVSVKSVCVWGAVVPQSLNVKISKMVCWKMIKDMQCCCLAGATVVHRVMNLITTSSIGHCKLSRNSPLWISLSQNVSIVEAVRGNYRWPPCGLIRWPSWQMDCCALHIWGWKHWFLGLMLASEEKVAVK